MLGTVLVLTPPARRASERNDGAQEGTIPGGPKGYIDMLGTVLVLTPPARRGKEGNSRNFPMWWGRGDKDKKEWYDNSTPNGQDTAKIFAVLF